MQMVLPLSPDDGPSADPKPPREEQVLGSWSGGERLMQHGSSHHVANVWFHFLRDGAAVISVRRHGCKKSHYVTGRWKVEQGALQLFAGGQVIASPLVIHDSVMHWADELLTRVPQEVAPLVGHS